MADLNFGDYWMPVAGHYTARGGTRIPVAPIDAVCAEIIETEWQGKDESERKVTTLIRVARRVVAEEYHDLLGGMQIPELSAVVAIASGLVRDAEQHAPNGPGPAGETPPG